MKKKLNILFFGTPKFGASQLNNIIKNTKHKIIAVVTKKKKNKIQNPVELIARKKKIPIFKPNSIKKLEKLKNKFKNLNIDIILVIAYGFKLPQNIIDIPKLGCFNLHASLLPRWRGSSPIQRAILFGDKYSGITFIKINKFIDAGNIIYQKKCIIKKNFNYKKLYKKIKKISTIKLPIILNKIKQKIYIETKQNTKNITYAFKIKKKEGLINWKKDTAIDIDRKIKAFYVWPKTYFYYKKHIIFIWSIKIKNIQNNHNYKPGQILKYNKKGLIIFTKKSSIIKIKKIQLNNHKKMKTSELVNSKPFLFKKGEIL